MSRFADFRIRYGASTKVPIPTAGRSLLKLPNGSFLVLKTNIFCTAKQT